MMRLESGTEVVNMKFRDHKLTNHEYMQLADNNSLTCCELDGEGGDRDLRRTRCVDESIRAYLRLQKQSVQFRRGILFFVI